MRLNLLSGSHRITAILTARRMPRNIRSANGFRTMAQNRGVMPPIVTKTKPEG